MATLTSKISDIQAAIDTLARQHKVPGASLGVMLGDELVEFVTGVTNLNTQVPVTPTTLFQIGSNTKVYTATMVMQLVDEGLVELDAPIKKYIPSLQLADKKARDAVTVRMLLTHTSGIEGDYFEEFGRGDDGIGKYVESLSTIGQITEPGGLWSYCNTGWTLLGYLVEQVRGEPYSKVLTDKIATPIGAHTTTVLMEDMLAHSCAVGHLLMPGQSRPIVAPRVMMSPSHAPAGSMTVSTAAQVLRFVRMHLDDGRARNGTLVLSVASAKAMQQPQTKLPFIPQLGTQMGLGWMIDEWDGERVLGHGGNTIGQASFLKLLPDRRFAVTLLTNCSTGSLLWRDLARYLFSELAGVHPSENPKLPAQPPKLDLSAYTGTYAHIGFEFDAKLTDGKLTAELKSTGPLTGDEPPQTASLTPIDKEIFLLNVGGEEIVAHFSDFRSGHPTYVHMGARVSKRTAGDGSSRTKSKPKPKSKTKAKPKAKAVAKRSAPKRSAAQRRPAAKKKARR